MDQLIKIAYLYTTHHLATVLFSRFTSLRMSDNNAVLVRNEQVTSLNLSIV